MPNEKVAVLEKSCWCASCHVTPCNTYYLIKVSGKLPGIGFCDECIENAHHRLQLRDRKNFGKLMDRLDPIIFIAKFSIDALASQDEGNYLEKFRREIEKSIISTTADLVINKGKSDYLKQKIKDDTIDESSSCQEKDEQRQRLLEQRRNKIERSNLENKLRTLESIGFLEFMGKFFPDKNQ